MKHFHAHAAMEAGGQLEPYSYDPGPIRDDDVEIDVAYCGLCHSDLNMIDNDWEVSTYPLVPGHEIVGTITALGSQVKHLTLGQQVGVGWKCRSCMHCEYCATGSHTHCRDAENTIIGRHGGFSNKVRSQAAWVSPLPAGISIETAGPLFCAGITTYHPLLIHHIQANQHIGVVGVGGLGHLGIQFARAWGCKVTAISTSPEKSADAIALGSSAVLDPRDPAALKSMRGKFDLILNTSSASLDWDAFMSLLRPKGILHIMGVSDRLDVDVSHFINGQKSVTGSSIGSPPAVAGMLEFCVRHGIAPMVEEFPVSRINEAIGHLRAGRARYRVVIKMN